MGDDKWERVIATKRTAFFPTKTLCAGKKYNNEEACKTAAIVNALYRLYERNGLEFDERSVGIIAPYRHQIARIRQELDKFGISAFDTIRVDTVERYGRVGTTDRPEIKRCVDSCSASAFRFGKFATVVSESDLPDFDNAFGKYIE